MHKPRKQGGRCTSGLQPKEPPRTWKASSSLIRGGSSASQARHDSHSWNPAEFFEKAESTEQHLHYIRSLHQDEHRIRGHGLRAGAQHQHLLRAHQATPRVGACPLPIEQCEHPRYRGDTIPTGTAAATEER